MLEVKIRHRKLKYDQQLPVDAQAYKQPWKNKKERFNVHMEHYQKRKQSWKATDREKETLVLPK